MLIKSKEKIQVLIPSFDDDSGSPRQGRLDSNSQLLTYSRNKRRENSLVCVLQVRMADPFIVVPSRFKGRCCRCTLPLLGFNSMQKGDLMG